MNIDFDIQSVILTEFGIGHNEGDNQIFYYVPVDKSVQVMLHQMVTNTISSMKVISDEPNTYSPSEDYPGSRHLILKIEDELSKYAKELHEASNLQPGSKIMNDTKNLFCYFVRLKDKKDQNLTAVRRATMFKGILKARLVRFATDSLKVIEDKVFKLDTDFDFIIDKGNVSILHPFGFEFVCNMQSALLEAAPKNVEGMQKELEFIDFAELTEYVTNHSRAARYLASIRTSGEGKNIDKESLINLCKGTDVIINLENGKIQVNKENVLGLLEVLDRRRYRIELVKGSPEKFKAPSREKI